MKSRRLLIAAAWLLSATAAFSLGRLGSATRVIERVTQSGAVAALPQTGTGATQSSGDEEFSLAGWFGSRATGIAEVIGGRSLEDHVKFLLKQDDESMRMLGFLRLLEALKDPAEIKSVLEVIAKDPNGRYRMTEQAMLLQKWTKLDPAEAATFASGLRDWSRFNGLNAVLKTWVKDSPEAAIAWAEKNGAPTEGGGQRGIGPGGEDGNWAVATLVNSLAKSSLDRAIDVAANQPYSRARGRMADTLISELISQRGLEAARSAVLDQTDEQFRAGMARELAQRLVDKDPKDAAGWANGLPAGETRQRAMAEVIGEWAQKDPVAAGSYLQQLGPSAEFDRARQDYAQRVVRNDPEGAIAWAQSITEEERRNDTMRDLLRSWGQRDGAAAQTWAQANGVPFTPPQQRGGPTDGRGGGPRGPGR
ncbi:MAG: hypothetical protein ABMA13_01380 [Chthoniobacteraceae bacterium]